MHAKKKVFYSIQKLKSAELVCQKKIIIVSIFHTDILNLGTSCLKKQHNTCKIYNQKNYPFKGVLQISRLDKQKNVYSTWCSQAVTHLSTNHGRRCLTWVIGREPVISTWYGRRQRNVGFDTLYSNYIQFRWLS